MIGLRRSPLQNLSRSNRPKRAVERGGDNCANPIKLLLEPRGKRKRHRHKCYERDIATVGPLREEDPARVSVLDNFARQGAVGWL
jgi:hypothetical protein